jgi:hypothetical protein
MPAKGIIATASSMKRQQDPAAIRRVVVFIAKEGEQEG